MKKLRRKQNIIITGASSGIGKALALHYINNGDTVALIGRRYEKLKKIKESSSLKLGKNIFL